MQSINLVQHKLLSSATFSDDFDVLDTVDFKTAEHLYCLSNCNAKYYRQIEKINDPYEPYRVLIEFQGDKSNAISDAAKKFLQPAPKNQNDNKSPFQMSTQSEYEEYMNFLAQVKEEWEKRKVLPKEQWTETIDYDWDMMRYYEYAKTLNQLILRAPRTKKPLICYRGGSDRTVIMKTGNITQRRVFNPQMRRTMLISEPETKVVRIPYFESQLKVGETFSFYGFTSTSLSPNISLGFYAKQDTTVPQCCFFQFFIPPNYPGLFFGRGAESEYLLPAIMDDGSVPTFVVTAIKTVKHKLRYGEPLLYCNIDNLACIKNEFAKEERQGNRPSIYNLRVIQLRPVQSEFNQAFAVPCPDCQ